MVVANKTGGSGEREVCNATSLTQGIAAGTVSAQVVPNVVETANIEITPGVNRRTGDANEAGGSGEAGDTTEEEDILEAENDIVANAQGTISHIRQHKNHEVNANCIHLTVEAVNEHRLNNVCKGTENMENQLCIPGEPVSSRIVCFLLRFCDTISVNFLLRIIIDYTLGFISVEYPKQFTRIDCSYSESKVR